MHTYFTKTESKFVNRQKPTNKIKDKIYDVNK